VELLVDNLRSALNVGSILRTADGAGVDHVHLCGITPTPRHPKVAKTALGAQETVPWTQRPNGLLAAEALRARGVTLIGLEAAAGARSLFDRSLFDRSLFDRSLFDGTPPDGPLALVVGSEITGIDPAILERCARVFFLPMLGVKESLNVAVALGIALYHLRFGMRVG
jgi:tRNA G18 (ribose-2'-O)-methylase SpoU